MLNVFIFLVFGQVLFISSVWGYTCKGDNMVERALKIKLIAFDVDGVLTTGEITYTANGDEIKTFNVKDGLGLVLASQKGFITALITGRESSIVERRGKELKVHHIYQNTKDKITVLEELASHYNLSFDEIAFMGDDLPDLSALKKVGLSCCPQDAVTAVKEQCAWISSYKGGRGAVRELTDFLLATK